MSMAVNKKKWTDVVTKDKPGVGYGLKRNCDKPSGRHQPDIAQRKYGQRQMT